MDIVVGAGMGGLSAAIRLARQGRQVLVLEARDRVGGLASGVDLDGRRYDGGPYILLDRPGLEWAFERLGVGIEGLELIRLDEVYRVRRPDGPTLSVYGDLHRTIDGIEAQWPGAGRRYERFVRRMARIYERLQPLQRKERPGPGDLLRRGLLREGLFLLRGLGHHLRSTGLPREVIDAIAIWTHIAGQSLSEAPAPLGFVPGIVHTYGAYTVRGGLRRIPEVLGEAAARLGVEIRLGARVARIVRDGRRVLGVEVDGERISADRVFSDVGVSTYLRLLDPPDDDVNRRLEQLPLQSPGVAAWLEVEAEAPFLQFWLPPGELTRVLVHPGAVDDTRRGQARLVSPVRHEWAERVGVAGQEAHLERLLAEGWWREGVRQSRVLLRRTPAGWGASHHLWRDSMNPVMTAAFMRRGRLPHVSPVADGLYLVGASTHPGQWVSFCAISGVLAADAAQIGAGTRNRRM